MKIEIDNFINSLSYMGKGMLGIFIVTGVIILVMYLLNKLSSGKEE